MFFLNVFKETTGNKRLDSMCYQVSETHQGIVRTRSEPPTSVNNNYILYIELQS
jgi:hypothetical protein